MFRKSIGTLFYKPCLGLAVVAMLTTAFIPNIAFADSKKAKASDSMTLFVVRHGETDWNAKGLVQGNTDNPLNAKGMGQAKAVASQLGSVEIDVIYPSGLARAIQTAEAIAAGVKAPIKPDVRLNERSRGIYEGRVEKDVKAEFERRFVALDDDMNGGESLRSISSRVGAMTRELVKKHMGQTVMVVGHSGVNPLVIGELIKLPPERAISEIKQGNDEIYKLQISPSGVVSIWKLVPETRLKEL